MGRAFEYRKARKLKRWGNMARTFTKIGKEISSCVKESGPDPDSNPRLRVLIQNAKAANMPKENVERAIKKAVSKTMSISRKWFTKVMVPFDIAILVETQTDNTTVPIASVAVPLIVTEAPWVQRAAFPLCSSARRSSK